MAARKLADFFLSDKGQEILVSFGFDPIRRGQESLVRSRSATPLRASP